MPVKKAPASPEPKPRLRYLNEHLFRSHRHARQIIEEWRIDYNLNRPHLALGNMPPAEFAMKSKLENRPPKARNETQDSPSNRSRSGSHVSLFDRAGQVVQGERERRVSRATAVPPRGDGLIFSGNRHDSMPQALVLDGRLTPLERNAWQVFRPLLNDDGITSFPTYDQLAPYLPSMPCTARASHETVARALTLLRLTRWISLVRRQRDRKTGRVIGNLYVLHDEPLTPFEAMQLDPDYLDLVSHALDHGNRSTLRIGMHVFKEMAEDPILSGRVLPSRLRVLSRRLAGQGWTSPTTYPQPVDSHESEEGMDARLRIRESPSSESEDSRNSGVSGPPRNPKTARTIRTETESLENHTIPRARRTSPLRPLRDLEGGAATGALAALRAVEAGSHQPILDEWDVRCSTINIRNPAGYVRSRATILKAAALGESLYGSL